MSSLDMERLSNQARTKFPAVLTTFTSRTSLGYGTLCTPIVHLFRVRGGYSCVGSITAKKIATFLLCWRTRGRFRRFEFTSNSPALFNSSRMRWVRCRSGRASGSGPRVFGGRRRTTTVCSPITARLSDRGRHFFRAISCAKAPARPASLRRFRKRWQGTLTPPGALKAVVSKSARPLFRLNKTQNQLLFRDAKKRLTPLRGSATLTRTVLLASCCRNATFSQFMCLGFNPCRKPTHASGTSQCIL